MRQLYTYSFGTGYLIDVMIMIKIKMVSTRGPRIHTISHATPAGLARLSVHPWDGIRFGTIVRESAWLK